MGFEQETYCTYSGEIVTIELLMVPCFLVTFYSVNEVKCDQKVEYGNIKSSIVRIFPQYNIASYTFL